MLEAVHDRTLRIRLHRDELDADLLRQAAEMGVDLIEGGGAVDLRLAPAEQVEIRAVDDEDPQARRRLGACQRHRAEHREADGRDRHDRQQTHSSAGHEKLPQRFPCGCTGASLSPSDHLIASNIMICTFRMSHASVL